MRSSDFPVWTGGTETHSSVALPSGHFPFRRIDLKDSLGRVKVEDGVHGTILAKMEGGPEPGTERMQKHCQDKKNLLEKITFHHYKSLVHKPVL